MKCLSVIFFFYFLIPVASAQKDTASQTLLKNRCKHSYISLLPQRSKNKLKGAFPFRNIEVVDYRPDTSRIGLFVQKEHQHDLLFKLPASNEVRSFLNEAYANPLASKTLLVVIRKLWFSNSAFEKQLGERSSVRPFGSRISFRAETYIKENEGYIPFAYFDTLITSPKAVKDIAPFRLPSLLASLMEKINSLDMNSESIKRKRLVSYAVVDSFSKKHFSYPIDTANILHKGVYASIEDFRNNQPSALNYEIKQEENSMMTLYLKDEQGKEYNSRKMWGFCDGRQSYVMMDGNLFPILPYNRAYYVYGIKEYTVKKYNAPLFFLFPAAVLLGAVPVNETIRRELRFFSLDVETGEIF